MEVAKGHPHSRQGKSPATLPPHPPPLQVACSAGVFWRAKVYYVCIVVAAIFDFMTAEEWGE